MGTQETSREAYHDVIKKETTKVMRESILGLISNPAEGRLGYTDRELSKALSIPINVLTARRNELLKQGLIEEVDRKLDVDTKRPNIVWGKQMEGKKPTNELLEVEGGDRLRKKPVKPIEQLDRIKLTRGMGGKYSWEISVHFDPKEDFFKGVAEKLCRINESLRDTYGEQKINIRIDPNTILCEGNE